MSDDWDGKTERRDGFCPVHNIKCDEWKDTDIEVKKRVPIWVFNIFLVCLIGVLGYQLAMLSSHVRTSSRIFGNVTHTLQEVTMNQRIIMRHNNLKFEHLPRFDTGDNNREDR